MKTLLYALMFLLALNAPSDAFVGAKFRAHRDIAPNLSSPGDGISTPNCCAQNISPSAFYTMRWSHLWQDQCAATSAPGYCDVPRVGSVRADTSGFFVPGSDGYTNQILIPESAGAGQYRFCYMIVVNPIAGNSTQVTIKKNQASVGDQATGWSEALTPNNPQANTATTTDISSCSPPVYAVPGDYFRVELSTQANNQVLSATFTVEKLP